MSLMTAYMEAADNTFRMFQQLALGDPLQWFDWTAAGLLALCVLWQGYMHYWNEKDKSGSEIPVSNNDDPSHRQNAADVEHGMLPANDIDGNGSAAIKSEAEMPLLNLSSEPYVASSVSTRRIISLFIFVFFFVCGCLSGALFGGSTGQAYVCATVATGCCGVRTVSRDDWMDGLT